MITVDKSSTEKRTSDSLLSVVIPIYQEESHIKNSIKVIERF